MGAVEFKIGKFYARFEGQLKLYLKWLDRYERQEHEEAPVGLILCTDVSRDQVELLEMAQGRHRRGRVLDRATPKAEFQPKLGQVVRDAQERLARRGLPSRLDDRPAAT